MSEILSYFFNPEASMDLLISEANKNKWKDGFLKWGMITVLAGLLTIVMYRVSGVSLDSIQGTYYGTIIENTIGLNNNEGIVWLCMAIISIIETLLIAVIKLGIWTALLYIANRLLKDNISLYQIFLMSIFCILTWLTAQVFSNIATIIVMFSSVSIINEMLLGIGMILGYWYLVIFIIGYSIAAESTFLKGGLVILVIQGILWGASNMFPVLQVVLG